MKRIDNSMLIILEEARLQEEKRQKKLGCLLSIYCLFSITIGVLGLIRLLT